MSKTEQQPVLSDLISALIASLSKGRFVADLEAMRLAMQYEKIELLKGLPVPRLRISNVKISMPVIMTEVIPGANAIHAPITNIVEHTLNAFETELTNAKAWVEDGISRNELQQDQENEQLTTLKWYNGFLRELSASDINFPTLFKNDFSKRLSNDLDVLETVMHGIVSAPAIIKLVGNSAGKSLNECLATVAFLYLKTRSKEHDEATVNANARDEIDKYLDHKIVKEFIAKVCFAAERCTIEQDDKSAEIKLLVDTESIKNAGGGPDVVTRLSFNFREEGLEWVTDISEEKEVKHLAPE